MKATYINGRFLAQPITGTQRYAHELLEELDHLLTESGPSCPDVTVLVPFSVKTLPRYRSLRVRRVGKLSGHLWEQLELPFYARAGLLFTPSGGAPILHRRNIITIHDAAVVASPRGYSWAFRTWYRFLNRALCRSALHIFTVSQFAKAELVKWYRADSQKVTVTYLGSGHALRPEPDPTVLSNHRLRRFQYALLVGSRNPNKNLSGLLKALPYLEESGLQVAIAGHSDPKVFGKLQISGEKVHDLGYVNDSELRTLYENAACFVFPSFYEGFGLPPLEALALGCPVVVAKSTALMEIFEGVAFMCNPSDPVDIAGKVLQASKSQQEARASNYAFASRFQWAECAQMTWRTIAFFSEG